MSYGPRLLPKQPMFVNRAREMADFLAWREEAAAAGSSLLVTVTGPEGIGKTTFSVVASHRVAGQYPDAQLHYDARGSDPDAVVTADQIAVYFLGQLGVPRSAIPRDAAERIGVLRSKLAHRKVLMLLDDVEDIELVRQLLFESTDAVVVVTSRRPLNGLRVDGFRSLRLAKFEGEEAAELLNRIAGGTIDAHVANTLCVLCDGLPLALAIAAVRLSDPDEPAAEYMEELVRGKSFDALSVDGVSTVELVFDAMYRDLDEDAVRAYTLLSLIPGAHFSAGVAAAVLDQDEAAVVRLLRGLTSKYVLERLGDDRFRFHNLIRRHALDRAAADLADEDIKRAVARAVGWYWHRAVALDQAVSGRPVPAGTEGYYQSITPAYAGTEAASRAFAEFDVEWPNLVAAARAAREAPRNELAPLFALPMWFYGYNTRRYPELLDAYHQAVPLARDERLRWQLHRDLAATYEGLGELDLAAAQVELAASVNYPAGTESVHTWYGIILERQGDLAGALGEFDKALDAVVLMRDPVQEERARALLSMHSGRVLYKLRDQADPAPPLVAAYEYFAARPAERVNQAKTGMWLGRVLADRGEPPTLLTTTLDMLRELDMRQDAADVADVLADIAESAGDAETAGMYRQLASELSRDQER